MKGSMRLVKHYCEIFAGVVGTDSNCLVQSDGFLKRLVWHWIE
jgi:hypothetical protein